MAFAPYELPSCWPSTTLETCLRSMRNGLSRAQNKVGDGYAVSRIETIAHGTVDPAKVGFVTGVDEDDIRSYRLESGDILFSHINSEPQIGRTAVYCGVPETLYHGMNLLLLRTDESKLAADFLHFLCMFLRRQGAFIALAGRAVGQSSISQGRLKTLVIPLPPATEQRAIAAVLGKLQAAVATQQAIIDRTAELKAALMAKLFTEGTRGEPTKDSPIGPIPESWQVDRIGSRARITSGGTPSRNEPSYWEGGTIPWVKTGEVDYCIVTRTEEHITEAGLENSSARLYPPGTLLIAMYGQGVTRGKVAILGIEAATNQACGAIFHDDSIATKFLYHYMAFAYDRLRTHSHGAQQRNLSGEIVANFEIAIPSEAEQREMAEILDGVDAAHDSATCKRELSAELFAAMLDELMTGRIRVNDLDLAALGVSADA